MQSKNILHFIFLTSSAVALCCQSRETLVTIANVCREKDQTDVRIKGFLLQTKTSSGLRADSSLLVENNNGTGGFITILFDGAGDAKETGGEVKIVGKVLKDENSCVLKVEKIESP